MSDINACVVRRSFTTGGIKCCELIVRRLLLRKREKKSNGSKKGKIYKDRLIIIIS
jgi:hypothetical protein